MSMSELHYQKPLNIKITTPDGKDFRAQLNRQQDHSVGGSDFDGETELLVCPSLCGLSWEYESDFEPGEMETYPSEDLDEWITQAVFDGWSTGEESNVVQGLSFEILNPDDHDGETKPLEAVIFGSLKTLAKIKQSSLDEHLNDVVIASDSPSAEYIKSQFTDLSHMFHFEDEPSEEVLLNDMSSVSQKVFKAAVIENAHRRHIDYSQTTPSKVVSDITQRLKHLTTDDKNMILSNINDEDSVSQWVNNIHDVLHDSEFPKIENLANTLNANSNLKKVNRDEVLENLPLVPAGSVVYSQESIINNMPCEAFYFESENKNKTLLGVSVESNDNTVKLYLGSNLEKSLQNEHDEPNQNQKKQISNALKR